ncbi:microtubule-associated protein 70-5 isoform X1 [Arachis duranensis]|uniref:Microtubule-associated protein 70-5 isoform X1 n=1 Tax=Arachis duranensis TaxID=130453 RepID=A0A6P4D417_ARADU|nr:microtubule-associated protein 70-5 isoform X1 [Arachis duranensis]XP_025694067.1 microtubule-associated protein 70-5 isoform X1 [Arachis hypogaea]
MVTLGELNGEEEVPLVQHNPLVLEINGFQNQLIEKGKELATCQGEVKALRATEALKDKAIEELRNEVSKLDQKLRTTENHLKDKNLEIKKLTEEKKDALAAQYAAEAALRRVHLDQKDDDYIPFESVITPLEDEIKLYKNEIKALQEDKKALERLTKSKELALLEAERILRSALERALIVEEVQNENFDLKRQIEICQEENKILEKTHRQKIMEVEKLSQTIHELEEVILASGTTANAVRDYKRQISELQEEKRTLERELARVKVSANRVATVVANEWKDEKDKVMPVRQWLEERRIMQAEMQRLKEKLAISERTAKAESQLKDKLKLRLKTLEEGLKQFGESPKTEKSSILSFLATNSGVRSRSTSQPRGSSVGSSLFQKPSMKNNTDIAAGNLGQGGTTKRKHGSVENVLKKGIWARSKVGDSSEKENEMQVNNTGMNLDSCNNEREADDSKTKDDMVSGFLYDRLQKEVISLRKFCGVKESSLQTKDEEIKVYGLQMLTKKVDALTKAMEVECKKMRREAAVREKEATPTKSEINRRNRSSTPLKGR